MKMHNLNLVLLAPDAKDGGDSSPPPSPEGATTEGGSQEAVQATGSAPEKTLQDVVLEAGRDVLESNKTEAEEPEAPAEKPEKPKSEEPEEGEADKAEEEQPAEEAEEEVAKPPPFHEHPDWKRMVAERDEARKKAEEAESFMRVMREKGATQEQVNEAVEIAMLMDRDPAAAKRRLQPYIDMLAERTGEKLPADLATEVEDGTISEARAKELAQLRAQGKRQQETTAQMAQRQFLESAARAYGDWEQKKKLADTAFPKKAKMVGSRLAELITSSQLSKPDDIATLAERAYEDVNGWLGEFVPKPAPTRKPLPDKNVRKTKAEPKTIEEVVMAAGQKYIGED